MLTLPCTVQIVPKVTLLLRLHISIQSSGLKRPSSGRDKKLLTDHWPLRTGFVYSDFKTVLHARTLVTVCQIVSLLQKRMIKRHEASTTKGLCSYVKFKAFYKQLVNSK